MTTFIIRDVTLAILVLATFLLSPAHPILQTALGLGIGLIIYQLHEWSHYLGAVATRASLTRAKAWYSPFLFSFDSQLNSRGQFIDMSWPGFATTFTCLALLYFFRPAELWADTAWLAALALTGFTVVVEGPLFLWAIVRHEVPAVEIPGLGNNPVVRTILDKLTLRHH